MATALRGWKAGGEWIREPGNLPAPGSFRRDARTLAAPQSTITLVLGGARSGKSELAERLAAELPPPVAFVATAVIDPARPDPDLAARIDAHRRRRPAAWDTIEAGAGLVDVLADAPGQRPGRFARHLGGALAPGFAADAAGLCAVLRARPAPTVLVSEEVGSRVSIPTASRGGAFGTRWVGQPGRGRRRRPGAAGRGGPGAVRSNDRGRHLPERRADLRCGRPCRS